MRNVPLASAAASCGWPGASSATTVPGGAVPSTAALGCSTTVRLPRSPRASAGPMNVTFIGPAEARGDLGNLTVVLHPSAAVEGTAPPGTVVALDAPGHPQLAAADANGTFRIAPA